MHDRPSKAQTDDHEVRLHSNDLGKLRLQRRGRFPSHGLGDTEGSFIQSISSEFGVPFPDAILLLVLIETVHLISFSLEHKLICCGRCD